MSQKYTTLEPEWWSRMDRVCGTDWTADLPARAREIAQAQRQLLGRWPSTLREQHGDQWVEVEREQSEYLHVSCEKLFHRMYRGSNLVKQVRVRLDGHALELARIRHELQQVMHRGKWLVRREGKRIQWDRETEDTVSAMEARKKHHNYSVRHRRRCFSALSESELLTSSVAQTLARMRWFDDLEQAHGDSWGEIATQNMTQWADNWQRTSVEAFPRQNCESAVRRTENLVKLGAETLARLKWFDVLEKEHGQEWPSFARKALFEWSVTGRPDEWRTQFMVPLNLQVGQRATPATTAVHTDTPSAVDEQHPD